MRTRPESWLKTLFRRFSRGQSAPARSLRLELLEARELLAATVYLDFGAAFPVGGLTLTTGQLRSAPLNGPDVRGYGLADTDPVKVTSFSSLINFDYNSDGRVNGADATDLKNAVFSLVQALLRPL